MTVIERTPVRCTTFGWCIEALPALQRGRGSAEEHRHVQIDWNSVSVSGTSSPASGAIVSGRRPRYAYGRGFETIAK